jgi:hypothetical protein
MRIEDVRRGQVYMVCLDPVFGREMGGFKIRGRLTGRAIGILSRDDFRRIEKSLAHCMGLVTQD